MSSIPVERTTKVIAIELIDPPELDMRVERPDDFVEELARDIVKHGQQVPIFVFVNGDRFGAVDGYTRMRALKSAGLTHAECFVFPAKTLALEGMKYRLNVFRLEPTPADEAKMMWELYHGECEQSIERVATICGKTINYVNARLELVGGDDLIFEAVAKKEIGLQVAAELNKIDEGDYRRHYLHHAIRSGAKVADVVGWVAEYKAMKAVRVDAPAPAVLTTTPIVASDYNPHRCYICREADPRFIPEQVPIHTHCKFAVLDKLLGFTAETPSSP